jgi:hypothetical protein
MASFYLARFCSLVAIASCHNHQTLFYCYSRAFGIIKLSPFLFCFVSEISEVAVKL